MKRHNNRILSPPTECPKCECSDICPVDGECMKSGIIYQATISTENNKTYTYTGLSMNTFKSRWTQHCSDFRVFRPIAKTTLSKKVWDLKHKSIAHNVKWKIVDRARQYTPMSKTCNLCISEVYHILFNPQNATLNSRNELKGHCRHWEQFRLSNFKT